MPVAPALPPTRRRTAPLLAVAAAALASGILLTASLAHATALLLPKGDGAPLALKHQRVTVDVVGGTATTQVEQVFVNHTSRPLEATYVFPLPADAVIVNLQLEMGGKLVTGKVLAKDEANRIYTDIVRRMRDPAIVDWMSDALFKARIFPVPANGEQRIVLTYSQVVPVHAATYRFSYPMKAPGPAAKTLEDLTLTVRLKHDQALKAIYSPTHAVSVGRKGDHEATVGFEGDSVTLDRDFVLYYGVSDEDVGLSVLTHRPEGSKEPGYFLMVATPKAVARSDEHARKAVTLVLDTSGSMSGEKIVRAKRALGHVLDELGEGDRFNVVRFSSDVEALEATPVPATPEALARARRFVESFEAAGGTAIDEALALAVSQDVPADAGPHLVVFVTDGRPTVGETDARKILKHVSERNGTKARIFTLGVGDDVHAPLLDRVAETYGGTSSYARGEEDLEPVVRAQYQQIAHPVMTRLGLRVDHVGAHQMTPRALPDLFKGGQVLVVGRYREAGDALVRLTGDFRGAARTFDFEATFPDVEDAHAFIPKLWAHREVGVMLDQVRTRGESPELVREIVQLATRFGIVTPYTSFLVVEPGMATDRPTPRPSPIRPLPRPMPREEGRGDTLDGAMGGAGTATPRAPRVRLGSRPQAAGAPASEPRTLSDAEAEATLKRVRRRSERARGSKDVGGEAVREAKAIKLLKEKGTTKDVVATVRHVAGRVFQFAGGQWTQQGVTGSPSVRVAPYSKAWMRLAATFPKLKGALALGERITLRIGGVLIRVEPGAAGELTKAQRKQLGID